MSCLIAYALMSEMNVRIGGIVSAVLLTAASGASAQNIIKGLTAGATYSDFQYPDTKSRWGDVTLAVIKPAA